MAKWLNRRSALIGAGLAAGLGAFAAKPRDRSGARDSYFLRLQEALHAAGCATPTLVVDSERLNANIATLKGHLPAGVGYRIVAKSLPSPSLLAHVRAQAETNRLMTFNLPMLLSLSQMMPDADQLLGKPLPVAAARAYFQHLPAALRASAAQVQWLIDTPERLAQYAQLADALELEVMRLNLELDVGLHRGGFVHGGELAAALNAIKNNPRLRFAGFMGYEPHIPRLPDLPGVREGALHQAWASYGGALAQAREVFDAQIMAGATRNAAGSPTYRYYQNDEIANEISAGSCLVKPIDFDTELLAQHQPAAFIATPVIKAEARLQLPSGLSFLSGPARWWDPNAGKTIFIYGGHWLAQPVDPPGLQYNELFGRSSNQEMLNGGTRLALQPDDFVFFRPTQSEAVLMQFGDIAVFDGAAIVARWPVFPASA